MQRSTSRSLLSTAWILVGLLAATPAGAAAGGAPERIPFAEFAARLQHDTCVALYGELADEPGWSCMQQDLLGTYRTDEDEHRTDMQLCSEHGGVLTSRIAACTEAMVHYVCIANQYDVDDAMTPLMEAYAAVSSRCWGQHLCVE